ncbi:hypothetical protein VNO80_09305 [Phaseolus coccineus]|uniref:Uncharacterized protein n=1 Tax=Phaseolus coccineus TaxID=3886 RepID=A0AAN9RCD2_PHACN
MFIACGYTLYLSFALGKAIFSVPLSLIFLIQKSLLTTTTFHLLPFFVVPAPFFPFSYFSFSHTHNRPHYT